MKTNTRLILRPLVNEYFIPKNYKIHPENVNSGIFSSLLLAEKIDSNKVAAIHYNVNGTFFQKSVSELNNQTRFDRMNVLRNGNLVFDNILQVANSTMESIPRSYHISETITNIERYGSLGLSEYPKKLAALNYLSTNFYTEISSLKYATNLWMLGKGVEIKVSNEKLLLNLSNQEERISGYISVENAPDTIQINLIFRGIPVPMKRVLTSKTGVLNNYIFIYPQYLLEGNIDAIQSINHLEVKTFGGARFWYGTNHYFKIDNLSGYSDKLSNLHIINKTTRNLYNQNEITNP